MPIRIRDSKKKKNQFRMPIAKGDDSANVLRTQDSAKSAGFIKNLISKNVEGFTTLRILG